MVGERVIVVVRPGAVFVFSDEGLRSQVHVHPAADVYHANTLVAGAGAGGRRPAAALLDRYVAALMEGLRPVATRARHVNVLQHAAGYFKRVLAAEEKAELGETIESFGRGLVPLVVPLTLLAHYTRIHREPWLARQHYLHLHPRELMLRNHV